MAENDSDPMKDLKAYGIYQAKLICLGSTRRLMEDMNSLIEKANLMGKRVLSVKYTGPHDGFDPSVRLLACDASAPEDAVRNLIEMSKTVPTWSKVEWQEG